MEFDVVSPYDYQFYYKVTGHNHVYAMISYNSGMPQDIGIYEYVSIKLTPVSGIPTTTTPSPTETINPTDNSEENSKRTEKSMKYSISILGWTLFGLALVVIIAITLVLIINSRKKKSETSSNLATNLV